MIGEWHLCDGRPLTMLFLLSCRLLPTFLPPLPPAVLGSHDGQGVLSLVIKGVYPQSDDSFSFFLIFVLYIFRFL